MADYFSLTVIQQSIPITDMTPLERLVLSLIFDAEPDGEAVSFHASLGPSDAIGLSFDRYFESPQRIARTDSSGSQANPYLIGPIEERNRGDVPNLVERDGGLVIVKGAGIPSASVPMTR